MKKTTKPINKNQGDLFAPKPQAKTTIKLPPGRSLKVAVTEVPEVTEKKEKLLTPQEELELKEKLYLERFIGKYHDLSLHDDD